MIRRLDTRSPDFGTSFALLEQRRDQARVEIERSVAEIVESVRTGGDRALIAAIRRFDGYELRPEELWVKAEAIAPTAVLQERDAEALRTAAERIRSFHARHVPASWDVPDGAGRLGQLVRPLERVALYVPAGTAPLASTLLMLGMPARVAGVPFLGVASPGAAPHPAVLEAARLVGVQGFLRAGGAHAVAALAFGTETVPRFDKIVGPGNDWVQAAKRQVFGQVGIDAEAGPSEVMIVADASAPATWVAADLLAQAEHDRHASVVLASPSAELLDAVEGLLAKGLEDLPRAEVARAALSNLSALVLTRDLDEAIELANRYAAEHLQLMVEDPEPWLQRLTNAAAVFVGNFSPVPAGDYVAGPSHVLPTGGTARYFSVVGVEDFQKRMSWIQLAPEVFAEIGPHAVRLAELEGLEGHARSLRARLDGRSDRGSD